MSSPEAKDEQVPAQSAFWKKMEDTELFQRLIFDIWPIVFIIDMNKSNIFDYLVQIDLVFS